MIKVILADDHKIMLEGMLSLLEKSPEINVIGLASDGEQVLALLENHSVDVVILDIEMPKMDGIKTSEEIRKIYPHIKILILSMYNEIGLIRKVMKAGVDGYILKNMGSDELLSAIEIVNEGGEYFGKDIDKTLRKSLRSDNIEGEVKLTKREKDVLKLISEGLTTKKISVSLNIADSTVETHRRNLIEKTGVANSKGLVKFAIEHGYS